MALPEILVPSIVPPYRATGHARAPGSHHRRVPMGTGHSRSQRVRTGAPTLVNVSTRMSAAAKVTHDAWYENTLQAGALPFSARVFGLETSTPEWWQASWQTPYQADRAAGGFWIVTGVLRLTGEPSDTPPVSTSAAVEFGLALYASAVIEQPTEGAVEFGLALNTAQLAAVEFGLELVAEVAAFIDRETSGQIEREGGGFVQRE